MFGADADAGVGHFKPQPNPALFGPEALHADLNAALVGELDGVAGQVHQHLAQAAVVALQVVGNARRQLGRQHEPTRLGARLEQLNHSAHQLAEVERFLVELEMVARFNL